MQKMISQKQSNFTMFVTILRPTAPNSISALAASQIPLGSLQCSTDPLAVFKGPVSKGREGKGEKQNGREGGKNGGRGL